MARSPTVLLLDDGELDDVQEILEKIGAPFGRVRGGAIAPNTPPPTTLLVATPRRIDAVREAGSEEGGEEPVRIVVVEGDSNTLRAKLRNIGFDYLVRRPVHPEALRLLLLHCLYTGEERRREPRVPVGLEVSFRTGLLPRRATLADLTSSGCRILSAYRIDHGKIIRIQIPRAVGLSEALTLSGRIIRVSFDERAGDEGLYSAAVVFENVTGEVRHELEWILEDRSRGPATLQAGDAEFAPPAMEVEEPPERDAAREPAPPPAADPEAPRDEESGIEVEVLVEGEPGKQEAATQESSNDRRKTRRGAYPRKVPAFGSEELQVLVGRDLSSRGMRVEHLPGLEIGDRLHLAVYGDPHQQPLLVWATVARDDGEEGMALTFDEPDPAVSEQLDKVVANLPSVEPLQDGEAGAMGTVVTKILER